MRYVNGSGGEMIEILMSLKQDPHGQIIVLGIGLLGSAQAPESGRVT
jgi:hypothetical protein